MVESVKCPFCASQSFTFLQKEVEMFLCHSCQRNTTWDFAKSFQKQNHSVKKVSTKVDYSTILQRATKINNLPTEHVARQYCEGRGLPKERMDDLYFVEDFSKFLQGTEYEKKVSSTPKIVIPLRSKHGLFGVQGRTLSNETPKYTTVKFVDCATIYGRDRVDTTKPIVVVEGPFDSMFVENSIAVTGSGTTKIDFEGDFIYCFDNEPRNKMTVKWMSVHLMQNEKVVIWPESIKQKDTNDMVKAGIDVNKVIHENIFTGAKGTVKLHYWKKV